MAPTFRFATFRFSRSRAVAGTRRRPALLTVITLLAATLTGCTSAPPLVIAHRGASGFLPEHTLEAYALAYGRGAQFIEPDVVASADGVPFAVHDITLERTTDVAERFPGRAREDGRFYVMDFSAAELDALRVVERTPGRFPGGGFALPRFTAVVDMIKGMNAVGGCRVGIYPELKNPAAHRESGLDLAAAVLSTLTAAGYTRRNDPVFLQSFDPQELERVRRDLQSDLTLIQLIGGRTMEAYSRAALAEIAGYADGIGVFKALAYRQGRTWVAEVQAMGLAVHVFTLRQDRVFEDFDSFADEVAALRALGVDGVFTDHPGATLDAFGARVDPVCGRR